MSVRGALRSGVVKIGLLRGHFKSSREAVDSLMIRCATITEKEGSLNLLQKIGGTVGTVVVGKDRGRF